MAALGLRARERRGGAGVAGMSMGGRSWASSAAELARSARVEEPARSSAAAVSETAASRGPATGASSEAYPESVAQNEEYESDMVLGNKRFDNAEIAPAELREGLGAADRGDVVDEAVGVAGVRDDLDGSALGGVRGSEEAAVATQYEAGASGRGGWER